LAFVLNGIFKIHVDGTAPMMFADLPAVISAIFFIHILDIARDLINSHNPNVPELVMNTAGALYGFTILESAYRVHEFKRVDDDYLSLATSYNLLGRYADAVSALDKMKAQTVASFRCRAAAFLGVSQFNRAWSDTRTALHLGGQSEVPEGDVFLALWQSAVTYSTPFNVNKVLIERAVALSLSDTRIAGALFGLGEEDKYKHILAEVFSDSEREKQFPICCTALHLLTKSRDHAMGGLAQIVPKNATEKLWKIFLEFLMIISNPETSLEEDRVAVDNWSRDSLQNVADSVTDVENAFDIGVSYGLIHFIYEWLDQAESQYTQSWLFLQNRVENILSSKPSTREEADMMKHAIANLPSISRR
jgi:hypothetical protein